MPTYSAILTTLGAQRLAEAQMSGVPLVFAEVAVGDGNGSVPTPSVGQTELVHETARVAVNTVEIYASAPSTVRIEGVIPAATGGFTVREVGFFNNAGELIVVASHPPTYKPVPADGVSADMILRQLLAYAAIDAIALTVDPAVVTASREYVDDATAGGLYLWENFV